MQLNSEQRNIIYFPPKESEYFKLKTDYLTKQLPKKYDLSLINKNNSITCRFPSGFKSFKEEFDQDKFFLDKEKIKVLTSKNPDERDNIENFENFLYEVDNPDKISDEEKVTVADPLNEEGSITTDVFYNSLVDLLCIYKQYFRNKYKIGATSDQITKYNQLQQKLYNKDNTIEDVEGFKISGTNTDQSPIDDINVVSNSTGSDLSRSDIQSSTNDINIVTGSTASHIPNSEISLTKENIDQIVDKVMEKLKESFCKKNTIEGGKRLMSRVHKKKKNITNVRKKRGGKKTYKKKVKKTKRKIRL